MTIRVTNRLMHQTVLRNVQDTNKKLLQLQNQISSGRRIRIPSDDPAGTGRAMLFRANQMDNEQYLKNVDLARSWLTATDVAMGDLIETLQRARELVVRGSNEVLRPDDMQAVRQELQQLLERTVQTTNSRFGLQYLFAGHDTETTPFTLVTNPDGSQSVVYHGDSGEIERSVAPGLRMTVGIHGNRGLQEFFVALTGSLTDLDNLDPNSLRTRLNEFNNALSTLTDLRTEVGAKLNRLESFTSQLSARGIDLTDSLSKVEDIDMAAAITELTSTENVYQAALATGARVIQPSLFDFLR